MKQTAVLGILLLCVGYSHAQNWESRAKVDLYGSDSKWKSDVLAVKTSARTGKVYVVTAGFDTSRARVFVGCDTCGPSIGVAIYSKDSRLLYSRPELTRFGANGEAGKQVDILDLAGDEALLLRKVDHRTGAEEASGALFRVTDDGLLPLLWLDLGRSASGCTAKATDCWGYKRELRVAKEVSHGMSDLVLMATGTRLDEETKKTLKAETLIYRFDGTKYSPVGKSAFDPDEDVD